MTGEAIGLEFLLNDGGDAEGLGDAGIETFRDKPFAAVARETSQNSRDARLDDKAPVVMTFDQISVPSHQFPSIESFRDAVSRCLAEATKLGNEKDIGFFKQATKVLAAPEIRTLRVADFNTKGVPGPCVKGKPFHTLAKADGVSIKPDINSGGSFGIGKSAASALSDIQTAFYSTFYSDEDGDHVLCMGKALLISHTGADGKERRRKGYWGKKKHFSPLDDPKDIPAWLLRNSQGTSIYSVCVRENRIDWRYEMAAALLINFFAAIQRQEMEFEIADGTIKINRNTIETLLNDPDVNNAVDQLKVRDAFDVARRLYACLVDEQAILKSIEVKGLGTVNLRMVLREKLGYTIGIVRNGMYITGNFKNFGEPFKRFPLHRDFALIIEPAGTIEGEWFKRLENPSHDDLSAERITDPSLRQQGQKYFEELAGRIRRYIREIAKSEPSASIELEELNDYFASEEAQTEDDLGTETSPKSLRPTPVKITPPKPKRRVAVPRGEDDDVPAIIPTPDPEPDPNPDPNPSPGPVNRKGRSAVPIDLERERNLLPDAANLKRRRLIFTSPVDGEVNLRVDASGLSTPDRLTVSSTKVGAIKNGEVIVSCKKGERLTIDVEFEVPYGGPIELTGIHMPEDEAHAE
jgi:hypothetical protein